MSTAASQATAASYGASATVTFLGFTVNEWGIVIGAASAFLTAAVNFYFRWRDDQRSALEHAKRMGDG